MLVIFMRIVVFVFVLTGSLGLCVFLNVRRSGGILILVSYSHLFSLIMMLCMLTVAVVAISLVLI